MPEKVKMLESTLKLAPAPNSLTALTDSVSPSLAPTWKVIVAVPFSRLMPLNEVCAPMSEISAQSWATSAVIAAWSAADEGAVVELDREVADALEHRLHLGERAFTGLHERDGVLGVALGLVEAADLGLQLLGDREAGGVVGGAVDPEARGEPLHRRRQLVLRVDEVAMGVERLDVGLNPKGHALPP